jgi:PEP-CTERM motif
MKLTLPAIVVAASAICHASTTYTVNETITLNPGAITSSAGHQFYSQTFGVASPVTVQAGDVITGTFSFIGGPILLESPSGDFTEGIDAFFSPVSGNPSLGATASIDLLGLQGSFPQSNPFSVNEGGCCFVTEQYSNGGAYDFSFTGFTYTISVNSVSTGSAAIYFSQFNLDGQYVEFGTAIPEPSSLAFCGLGFAALAWIARRTSSEHRSL